MKTLYKEIAASYYDGIHIEYSIVMDKFCIRVSRDIINGSEQLLYYSRDIKTIEHRDRIMKRIKKVIDEIIKEDAVPNPDIGLNRELCESLEDENSIRVKQEMI